MNNFSKILGVFLIVSLLWSCKAIKEFNTTFKGFETKIPSNLGPLVGDIDSILQEMQPIEEFTKKAVLGILEGTADTTSLKNIDTLSARLSAAIKNELNEIFPNLNSKVVGTNLIQGVKDSLLTESTTRGLSQVLDSVVHSVMMTLQKDLKSTFDQLNSGSNSLLDDVVNDRNSKKLSDFFSNAIANVDFKPIGEKIVSQILTEKVSNRIDSVAASAVLSAEAATADTRHWLQRYSIWLIIGIVIAAFAIILLRYLYKRKNLRNISNLMMSEIHAIEDDDLFKKVTDNIKQKAISQNIEADLHKALKKQGLVKRKTPDKPSRKWY